MTSASVGVCAFNEEMNIRSCLDSILGQRLRGQELLEVIVVSSGSTDRTDSIVLDRAAQDPRVRLLRQQTREGKNSAINAFMDEARGEVLVLANADNRLADGSLQSLLAPFEDQAVGMVGGHPVPVNRKDSLAGFAVHMLWDMHHRVSLIYPKAGELVAFRRLEERLPVRTQSDEDIIRMFLERKGLRTVYAEGAVVYNKGPDNLRDFMVQRARVNIGERYMKRTYDYDIPTWDARLLFQSFVSFLRDNRRHPLYVTGAMGLELAARAYASLYVRMDKGDKAVWRQVASTKDLASGRR